MLNSSLKNILVKSFGKGELSRDSINFAVCCPSCNDGKKSKRKLVIRLDTGFFHCWVCGLKGKNIEYLFRKYSPSAISLLPNARYSTIKAEEEKIIELPKGSVLLYKKSIDPDILAVKKYLKKRCISDLDIKRWRIMACPSGRHARRVIIPSFDKLGKINYYISRTIDENIQRYRNAKAKKNEIIFNEIDINWKKRVILVEGVFDAIKCPDNSIPILGSSLSNKSVLHKELVRNSCEVIISLDADQKEKAYFIAHTLSHAGCLVQICFAKPGRDLGSLTRSEASDVLKSAVPYNRMLKISHRINKIKSGSII
jgi:DNA primase